MADKVKSGKEILDDFFNGIEIIENVDTEIAKMLAKLYKEGSLTEKTVKNELDKLRAKDVNKD
jgi:hypothetical protein